MLNRRNSFQTKTVDSVRSSRGKFLSKKEIILAKNQIVQTQAVMKHFEQKTHFLKFFVNPFPREKPQNSHSLLIKELFLILNIQSHLLNRNCLSCFIDWMIVSKIDNFKIFLIKITSLKISLLFFYHHLKSYDICKTDFIKKIYFRSDHLPCYLFTSI